MADVAFACAVGFVQIVACLVATAVMNLLDLPMRGGVVIYLALSGAFLLGNLVGVERARMSPEFERSATSRRGGE